MLVRREAPAALRGKKRRLLFARAHLSRHNRGSATWPQDDIKSFGACLLDALRNKKQQTRNFTLPVLLWPQTPLRQPAHSLHPMAGHNAICNTVILPTPCCKHRVTLIALCWPCPACLNNTISSALWLPWHTSRTYSVPHAYHTGPALQLK